MLLALSDYRGGIDGLIGLLFFQPLFGFFVSIIVTAICYCLFFPLRKITVLKVFFIKHYKSIVFLFCLGWCFVISSLLPFFGSYTTIQDYDTVIEVLLPNPILLFIGFLAINLALFNFYSPRRFLKKDGDR